MIERARIVTSGKIKTSLSAVKDNISFWNDLHQLGLTWLGEKPSAAAWAIANCIIAVRESGENRAEIHLLVARRQADYQWFYGLQPEETARECWNQIFQLVPREMWDTTSQQIYRPLPKIGMDIAGLAAQQPISEFAWLARIGEIAEERYGKSQSQQESSAKMDKIRELLAQAEAFKREQHALEELAPDQLAEEFLKMVTRREKTATRSIDPLAVMKAHDGDGTRQDQPVDQTEQPRKGGPKPAPDAEKEKIVQEWLLVQGQETQESFCNRRGIGTSTLRAWMRELRAKKSSPS